GILPGDNGSAAIQINSAGTVVGISRYLTQSVQFSHAFIWHDGVMQSLSDLVDPSLNLAVNDVGGISDSGKIVSAAQMSGVNVTVILTPRPFDAADIDRNCRVDMDDLLRVIRDWGQTRSPADVNRDGIVDLMDLMTVLNRWTFN